MCINQTIFLYTFFFSNSHYDIWFLSKKKNNDKLTNIKKKHNKSKLMYNRLGIVHIEKNKTCIDESLPNEYEAGDSRKTLLINPKTISYRKEYSVRRL